LLVILVILIVVGITGGVLFYRWYTGNGESNSNTVIRRYLTDPSSRPELTTEGYVACPGAPFILPSEGLIGLLWRDPARPYDALHRHQGVDIFGDGPNNTVAIVAAYDGWLTRLPDWRSTVIIRHDDPLQPGRTIWTYYTHMASTDGSESYIDAAFPPGTSERFVEQGTLLGYQGDYGGDGYAVAMHLHFSIVLSDADGNFLNEALLENTLDPSPYLGLPLDIADQPQMPIRCGAE
jgi:hypothetical protein